MIIPHLPNGLEQPFPFLSLLHILAATTRRRSGRKRRDDHLPGELIEVLRHQPAHAVVQHARLTIQTHVVRIPVVLLEGQIVRAMVVNFGDGLREGVPELGGLGVWYQLKVNEESLLSTVLEWVVCGPPTDSLASLLPVMAKRTHFTGWFLE